MRFVARFGFRFVPHTHTHTHTHTHIHTHTTHTHTTHTHMTHTPVILSLVFVFNSFFLVFPQPVRKTLDDSLSNSDKLKATIFKKQQELAALESKIAASVMISTALHCTVLLACLSCVLLLETSLVAEVLLVAMLSGGTTRREEERIRSGQDEGRVRQPSVPQRMAEVCARRGGKVLTPPQVCRYVPKFVWSTSSLSLSLSLSLLCSLSFTSLSAFAPRSPPPFSRPLS